VTVPRGPDHVVAVLGVLRAGGAYVPVAVDQPVPRRDRIYARAGVRFAVGAGPLPDLPEGIAAVPLDGGPGLVPAVGGDPDALAYLLFTSGSTGEPKGVMVPHRAAVNTIDAVNERFGVDAGDRVLAVSAPDFDLSVYDMFGLLSVGGSVVLVDDATRRDAAAWVALVQRWGVTVWQSVPALLEMLLVAAEGVPPGELALRLALLGGDWVGVDLSDRLARRCPAAQLVALGGTTETAIHSTVQPVPVCPPEHWRAAPYGRPLPNQRMRVVDTAGRDRPDWVEGELWIGGASVADGYRGDRDRTADRFVTHDGVRWYRTGDLARYWPDGTVEFLGRADFQVKIRGHRIELGEIDAALASYPGVTRGVAVAVGDGTRKRLAAAVTGAGAGPAELSAHLAALLPSYMVPDPIVVLDALPLSANGKVDRPALARLLAAPSTKDIEAPAGPVEAAVAGVWADLLGTAPVGRDQSFFALGGDSLVATRMLPRLAAAGLAGGTLRQLFATPLLKDFAATLTASVEPERPALVPDPAQRYEPFPPTDVQRAYWMGRLDDFSLGGVGSHWYWEFDGTGVDLGRLEEAVNRLVVRHDMLRAVFDAEGNQRVLAEVPRFTIEVHDPDALRARLSHRVPDPSRWPLLEIGAAPYNGGTRVGFSLDYIVLDALSIVTFFGELSTLYRDPAAELPAIGVGFRDYVVAAPPDPGELAAAQKYWTDRLDTLPAAPPLPLAVDPEAVRAPRFVRRDGQLPPEQWRALTGQARRHGVTPAVVLAAAFAEVLAAWSDRDRLTVNLTLFNRRPVHPDIDRVLGDFTSLLLAAYHAEPGFLAGVRRLQEQVWQDMEHTAVSAIWVLRELARAAGTASVSMPVVFTSALGVAAELTDMSFPFGDLAWGVSQTPQVWLDNQVMERAGGLAYNWDSVDELFPPGVLDGMFGAYRRLLSWLATADWSGPVPDLLPAGTRRVRDQVNATAGLVPGTALHEAFFARARTEPERLAVAWDGTGGAQPEPGLGGGEHAPHGSGMLSYGELAERALRIAGALRGHGLGAGEPVAVSLPRGPDQLAAVLGIL
ncbi:MAG TPA: amino acid adenylation domain-containing protein, partial [Rugosimonospora sp.]|nr:amino acid adenylation domain-containing protein [Rugosimonospora sp.]